MKHRCTFRRFTPASKFVALLAGASPTRPLEGVHVVFTGCSGRSLTRAWWLKFAQALGAHCSDTTPSIRRDTLVVVCPYASPGWVAPHDMGTKLARAESIGAAIVSLQVLVDHLQKAGVEVPPAAHSCTPMGEQQLELFEGAGWCAPFGTMPAKVSDQN